jgi:hypothetical protein
MDTPQARGLINLRPVEQGSRVKSAPRLPPEAVAVSLPIFVGSGSPIAKVVPSSWVNSGVRREYRLDLGGPIKDLGWPAFS